MVVTSSNQSTILVVDDDDDILKMTSFVLERLGYRVATVNGGIQGLHVLKVDHLVPCLIILDLMMPGMDGATFRKKLLEIPEIVNVPIIVLSGDTEVATKAGQMSVAGFEQKPISLERLSAIASQYCRVCS